MNRPATRRLLLAATSLLLLAGCDRINWPAGQTKTGWYGTRDVVHGVVFADSPLLIEKVDRARAPCTDTHKTDRPPAETEAAAYASRLSPTLHVVTAPLDVECLAQKYSLKKAKHWAKRNDPVGLYVYLFKRYRHAQDVCDHLRIVDEALDRAYAVKADRPNPDPGWVELPDGPKAMLEARVAADRRRLPEAYFIKLKVDRVCSGAPGDAQPFSARAASVAHGFDPDAGRAARFRTG